MRGIGNKILLCIERPAHAAEEQEHMDWLAERINQLGGKPDFSSLFFTINGAEFRYGAFITDLIGFILTAAAVFFFVVKPIGAILAGRKQDEVATPAEPTEEIVLLREIRDAIKTR